MATELLIKRRNHTSMRGIGQQQTLKYKSEGGHEGCTENKKSQSKNLEESYDDKTHDFFKVF